MRSTASKCRRPTGIPWCGSWSGWTVSRDTAAAAAAAAAASRPAGRRSCNGSDGSGTIWSGRVRPRGSLPGLGLARATAAAAAAWPPSAASRLATSVGRAAAALDFPAPPFEPARSGAPGSWAGALSSVRRRLNASSRSAASIGSSGGSVPAATVAPCSSASITRRAAMLSGSMPSARSAKVRASRWSPRTSETSARPAAAIALVGSRSISCQ